MKYSFTKYNFNKDKRKHREKSLEEIQDLYERTLARHKQKHSKLMEIYNRIITEIPENERGEKIVYVDSNDDSAFNERYHKLVFSYEREYDCFPHHSDKFFKETTVEGKRKEYLDYLTDELFNLRIELGTLYARTSKEDKYIHTYIRDILLSKIKEKVENMFTDKKCDKIFHIKIKDKIYVCMAENYFSRYYKKIKVFQVENNEPINLI